MKYFVDREIVMTENALFDQNELYHIFDGVVNEIVARGGGCELIIVKLKCGIIIDEPKLSARINSVFDSNLNMKRLLKNIGIIISVVANDREIEIKI